LWKGIAGSVVQALSKMASEELVHWGLQRAKAVWETMNAAQKTTTLAAAAAAQEAINAGVTATTVAEDQVQTASAETTMAARIYAWYSSLGPWAIPAAAATIAAIIVAISEIGKITAHAAGGVIDQPTLALLGEVPGSTEIVANERDFKSWGLSMMNLGSNLGANLQANESQVNGYSRQASSYAATGASAAGQVAAAPAALTMHVHLDNANIMDTTRRGLTNLGNLLIDATRAAAREKGVVLVPGQVFPGA
jgi:hypothetical protein